jgi:hypothetical protein
MAITIRIPDPTNEYDVSNQRQIVRSINNVVQQINAQYKPQGEVFSEIEQLSYFLGNAPAKPSGPDTAQVGGSGGIIWSKITWPNDFFGAGVIGTTPEGFPIVSGGSFQASRNRGYLIGNVGYSLDPPIFRLPVEPPIGTQVGVVCGGYNSISISAGYDSRGYQIKIDGYFTNLLAGFPPGKSRTYVYFGDGGYAAGYTPGYGYGNFYNTWYSIARGYK